MCEKKARLCNCIRTRKRSHLFSFVIFVVRVCIVSLLADVRTGCPKVSFAHKYTQCYT